MNTARMNKGSGKRRGSACGSRGNGADSRSARARGDGSAERQVAEIDRTFTARWEC
jgi:hypothetical protein